MSVAFGFALVCACGPRVAFPGEDEGGSASASDSASASGTMTSGPGNPTVSGGGPGPWPGTSSGPMPGTSFPATDSATWGGYFDIGGLWDVGNCEQWATYGCGIALNTDASATSDHAYWSIEPRYAIFASDAGCGGVCTDIVPNVTRIILTDDPNVTPDGGLPADALVLEIYGFEGPLAGSSPGRLDVLEDGAFVGGYDVWFQLDSLPSADDLAEPFNQGSEYRLTGVFDLADFAGIGGFFSAVYCPQLNSYAICE